MNRVFKVSVLAAAIAATSLSALSTAEARDGWRRHGHHDRHNNNGDLVAAGVAGLALGAIVGGLASSNERQYVDEPDYVYREPVVRPRPYRGTYIEPAYVDGPEVVYADRGAEPWSRDWYSFCESRYRSFNARTGTFVGYDGAEHFCVAN